MENTSNTFFRQLLTELIQSRVSGKTISEDDFVEKLLHGISVHGVGGCDCGGQVISDTAISFLDAD